MDWVVKLTEHAGQYRITLPRKLLGLAGLEGAEFLKLRYMIEGKILVREYHGKGKEKRGIPEDQS